jgi:type IV pilus assembly protein PilO
MDAKQATRKFTLALVILLGIDLTCGIVLISPIGKSARGSQQELAKLWSELQLKTRETMPLQGINGKVEQAKTEIKQFMDDRMPGQSASIPDELGKVASENKVILTSAKYKTEDTDIPGIRRVIIQANLNGPYSQEARFINAVERDKLFFIIDSISLGEEQTGGVLLQIQMETYIRSEESA